VRRLYVLGLLLLLAALIAFFSARETDEVTDERSEAQEPTSAERAQLEATKERSQDAPGPGLESRGPPISEPPRTDSGHVTVTVVGPDGTGLPSVYVAIVRLPDPSRPALDIEGDVLETDNRGQVVFGDVPYDGSRVVMAYLEDPRSPESSYRRVLPPAAGRKPAVSVRSERVVYRAAVGIWLQVHVVDAEDGRAVPHAETSVPGARMTGFDESSGDPRYLVLLNVDDRADVPLHVVAPRGYVAWEPSVRTVAISPYARRLVSIYPVRPEVPVTVSVSEPGGEPTRSPAIESAVVAGRKLPASADATDAYGRLRIGGVPYLRGEEVSVRAKRAGGIASALVRGRIPDDPATGLHFDIVLPPANPYAIGMGGGAGGAFRGRSSSRSLQASGSHRHPKGAVLVSVRRRDGRPAAGARVWLEKRQMRTDASGVARFDRVGPGTYAVTAKQVGLLPLTGEVTVKGEESARLELRETEGGRLAVQVVDEDGKPLSFATLKVTAASGHPWVDLDGDVQRVDPFTDHEGRRVLNRVEPGGVTVSAAWGSRKKQMSVRVAAAEETEIRIVLRSAGSR